MNGQQIQIQKNKINLTENQLKVIKDKYLKDSPTVEDWLYGIATNIALGDILHIQGVNENQIFEGVKVSKEITEPLRGNVSRAYLFHKGVTEYNSRNDNIKKFLENLKELATTDPKCIKIVEETAQKFYNLMSNFEFLPNSPTLMNAGRDLQQLSACYVLPVEDSIEGWLKAVTSAGIIHKSGGGTGFSVSRVRPKGSNVKSTKGVASGPLSPLRMIDGMTEEIKQGGCVSLDTRISTKKGLIEIGNLVPLSISVNGWANHKEGTLTVMTDEGEQISDECYNNGKAEVITLKTKKGYSVTATLEHRFRIIDEEGNYVWKHLKDIKKNDWVCFQKDTYPDSTDYEFPKFDYKPHFNAKPIKIPTKPSRELGEIIGCIIGDGAFSLSKKGTGRIIISYDLKQKDFIKYMTYLIKETFGIVPGFRKKENDESILGYYSSTTLYHWFKNLDSIKKESSLAKIPEFIFRGGRELAYGFLSGLFTADGTVSKHDGIISLSSTSKKLVDETQILLLSLGIPSNKSVNENRKGAFGNKPIYELRIITSEGYNLFVEKIGFLSKNKKSKYNLKEKRFEYNSIIPNQETRMSSIYNYVGRGSGKGRSKRGANRGLYRDIMHYISSIKDKRNLTKLRLQKLAEKHEEIRNSKLMWFLDNNQFYDQVFSLEYGETWTVDLSVPKNNTYIANGFISHNTRRGANMGILSVHHPDIMDFITIKKTQGQLENFNISVAIDDEFMEAVRKNTEYDLLDPRTNKVIKKESARKIWDEMVKGAWETGDPGFVVIDRINNTDSNPTPHLGMIESTNPCVAEGTLVNTPNGYKKVEEFKVGDKISTVYGSEPIDAIEKHNDTNVFKIKFSDGGEQIVTAAHRYYGIKKGSHSKKLNDYRIDELKIGDYIRVEPTQLLNSSPEKYIEGLQKGILIGDGCYTEDSFKKNIIKIASNSTEKEYNLNIKNLFSNQNFRKDDVDSNSKSMNMLMSNGRTIMQTMDLTPAYSYEKTFDITSITSVDEVIGLLDGLLATDGNILLKSNHPQVRFTTSSIELAQNIRRLLLMIGCHGRIFSSLHDDGGTINGRKIVRKHTRYDIIISGSSARIFATKSQIKKINPNKGVLLENLKREWLTTGNTWKAAIVSIEPFGTANVYDLYCSGSDTWITDGYVQRGCGEQPLLPNEPCFAPDTLITTKGGLETIEDLYKKQETGENIIIATDNIVHGKNGLEFRPCLVSKTGHKKILKVELNNGQEIKITPNHRLYTIDGWKRADELTREDSIYLQDGIIYKEKLTEPSIATEEVSNELLLGWLCGDGWFVKGKRYSIGICFGPEETFAQKKLIPAFKKFFGCNSNSYIDKNDVIQIATEKHSAVEKLLQLGLNPGKAPNKEVPKYILSSDKEQVALYLGGLFSADGEVSSYRRRIRFTSASPKLIKTVQLLLLNFGIKSRISKSAVDKRVWWELAINGESYDFFANEIGFPLAPRKQELMCIRNKRIRNRTEQRFSKIKSILDFGYSDVYDITEPETYSLIANGMVVHNCNLGSINLSKFIRKDGSDFEWERLKECVWNTTHFLDNVIEVNNYPLEEIEDISKKNRRIGLGVMGWAESLVLLGLPYNSPEALNKAEKVMQFINDNCLFASIELGNKRGIFFNYRNSIFDPDGEYFRGHDIKPRNCARTTIAPTGTIGITAGLQGAGIEPFFAIAYTRYNAKGIDHLKEGKTPPADCTFWEINPLFKEIAKKNNYFGLNEEDLWKRIEKNHKAIKGVEEIPERIQNLFLTSHDLDPKDHILMQAAFQKHTNNAVSKTINLRNEATIEDVEECYMLAYDNGCKGVTIYRDGSKQFQVLNLSDKKVEKKEETNIIYQPKIRIGKGEAELSTYYKVPTGYGDLHMHINYDDEGPLRIFANISPTGTEVSGLTCVIGILLSKYFEYGGDPIKVLKHLNSIKGDKPYGFGTKRIDSIPHAMAQALRDHLIKTGKMAVKVGGHLPNDDGKKQLRLDVEGHKATISIYCPQCYSSNVEMVSGCSEPTCFDCGYSKCS